MGMVEPEPEEETVEVSLNEHGYSGVVVSYLSLLVDISPSTSISVYSTSPPPSTPSTSLPLYSRPLDLPSTVPLPARPLDVSTTLLYPTLLYSTRLDPTIQFRDITLLYSTKSTVPPLSSIRLLWWKASQTSLRRYWSLLRATGN